MALVQAGSYSFNWTPSLGTSICLRSGPRKRQKDKTKKKPKKKKKERERENGKYLENTYTDQSDPGDREKLKTREKRKEGVKFLKR